MLVGMAGALYREKPKRNYCTVHGEASVTVPSVAGKKFEQT
ncbi:hypothetical protein Poly21_16890 [Allorhodopirellula heiligendammensis]|uniref:Uncharacterized protein n=1 Tax=Allorhodopirellula heiligendammensis TaxID=2714739 RepID=A0A5C6C7W3_9BACT|nr:hypothetical protein Poly21_16890 [Allorhodopirellula heiligendammensis]